MKWVKTTIIKVQGTKSLYSNKQCIKLKSKDKVQGDYSYAVWFWDKYIQSFGLYTKNLGAHNTHLSYSIFMGLVSSKNSYELFSPSDSA